MIVHLRVVPGLRIAAEERRRPELRSYPVVIGGLPHQRGAVCEASFAAQRCGVQAGMQLSQAHHHCPDGIFLTPDPPYYEHLWGMVCDVLRRSTPLVEPLEMGQAVCDLSGCERRWSDPLTMAQAIAAQLWTATALSPWLGVASNRLVAQLASTIVGAEGIAVVDPGRERSFLANLPITLLPDVDDRLALTFQVLGLRTIGQFAALPPSAVKQRFGAAGEKLYRSAHGIDERPVLPPPPPPSVTARHECEDGSLQEAIEAIHRLAEECAAELERRRLAGRLVTLTLEWAGGGGFFPIPYRIHSMLPQPGPGVRGDPDSACALEQGAALPPAPAVAVEGEAPDLDLSQRVSAVVRTPVHTALALLERGQSLLLQRWPRSPEASRRRLGAIELEIAEFEAPAQCSFAELSLLGQTGRLSGMSADRLQKLVEQEQALTARYGDAPFRHVTQLDPGNALAERRFRWTAGLPWTRDRTAEGSRAPRRGRRRP